MTLYCLMNGAVSGMTALPPGNCRSTKAVSGKYFTALPNCGTKSFKRGQ